VGFGVATPLGATFSRTWERAVRGEAGFRRVTRCKVDTNADVVGEIPDWDPLQEDFITEKDVYNWNAGFVLLTMAVAKAALRDAGLDMSREVAARTAALIGSSLNGHDAFRAAMIDLEARGPNRVSPYLLPNLCGNVPSGKAGMMLGFQGINVSPQAACASGNYAIGLGARLIRDGDQDFALVGGLDTPLIPEIIHGFANMGATIKVKSGDRAYEDPTLASRPFSVDRRGFVLSEGAGILVLASDDAVRVHGLTPRAEVMGVGWTSDAYHFTKPNPPTIERAMRGAIDDAGLQPADIGYVNAHGTSTPRGDSTEMGCFLKVFKEKRKPAMSSNKSMLGHTLGASAAIEAALSIEGMRRGVILPTVNHLPDPRLPDIDVVPNTIRRRQVEFVLSNAFGFGGTNCCIVFRGV